MTNFQDAVLSIKQSYPVGESTESCVPHCAFWQITQEGMFYGSRTQFTYWCWSFSWQCLAFRVWNVCFSWATHPDLGNHFFICLLASSCLHSMNFLREMMCVMLRVYNLISNRTGSNHLLCQLQIDYFVQFMKIIIKLI